MTTISNFKIIFTGGTEEERRSITDAVILILVEHGVSVENMSEWDG
jgi:hypothetical protein